MPPDTEGRRESQRLTHHPKLGHSGLVQRIQEGREEGKEGVREEREGKRMGVLRAPSAHILLSQLSPSLSLPPRKPSPGVRSSLQESGERGQRTNWSVLILLFPGIKAFQQLPGTLKRTQQAHQEPQGLYHLGLSLI